MKKQIDFLTPLLLGLAIGMLVSPFVLVFIQKNLHTKEESYLKRLEICLPHKNVNGDYNGDYIYIQRFCEDAEKEYLYLFDELYKTKIY